MSAAEKLLAEALTLPVDERAKLVKKLAESLPDESGEVLSTEANRAAWDAWTAGGEQGPIADGEGAPELP